MYGNKVKDWTILSQAPFQGEGATTIENTSNDGSGRRRYPREEYRDPDYNRYF